MQQRTQAQTLFWKHIEFAKQKQILSFFNSQRKAVEIVKVAEPESACAVKARQNVVYCLKKYCCSLGAFDNDDDDEVKAKVINFPKPTSVLIEQKLRVCSLLNSLLRLSM